MNNQIDIVKGIISKVNSRVKFLYKYKDLLNFESRKTLCSALIQCLFDYSCSSLTSRKRRNILGKPKSLKSRAGPQSSSCELLQCNNNLLATSCVSDTLTQMPQSPWCTSLSLS